MTIHFVAAEEHECVKADLDAALAREARLREAAEEYRVTHRGVLGDPVLQRIDAAIADPTATEWLAARDRATDARVLEEAALVLESDQCPEDASITKVWWIYGKKIAAWLRGRKRTSEVSDIAPSGADDVVRAAKELPAAMDDIESGREEVPRGR